MITLTLYEVLSEEIQMALLFGSAFFRRSQHFHNRIALGLFRSLDGSFQLILVLGPEVRRLHGLGHVLDMPVGWGFKMPLEDVFMLGAGEPAEDATATVVHDHDAQASWQRVCEECIRVVVEGNVPRDQPRLMGFIHVVGDVVPPQSRGGASIDAGDAAVGVDGGLGVQGLAEVNPLCVAS